MVYSRHAQQGIRRTARAPCHGQGSAWRYPLRSLRTSWYVLLELTQLRSSATPRIVLSLPRKPESGCLSPLFHCFLPDNCIPGFPPTQGSPQCQMDDPVTLALSFLPHTLDGLEWDPSSHASRSSVDRGLPFFLHRIIYYRSLPTLSILSSQAKYL